MSEGRNRKNPADRGYAPKRQRARKNTRRWCRGKIGVEHEPILVGSYRPCAPAPEWANAVMRRLCGGDWWCGHRSECANCGRVLNPRIASSDCPDRP